MNISSILGFFIAAGVLGYAVHDSQGAKEVLLNMHALMIVVGGTAAAAFICFPFTLIIRLSFLAAKKIIGFRTQEYHLVIRDVISVAEGLEKDSQFAKNAIATVKHPFLKEGLQLIVDGVTEEQFMKIMSARIETVRRRYAAETNMFRTIGKFPPAFGLDSHYWALLLV